MEFLTSFLPGWLIEWLQIYAAPFFKLQLRAMLRAMLLGVTDTILFITLPLSISIGSQAVWNARYHLTATQQAQIEQWASVSQLVAYLEDVPPMVPLVLWYKEAGLKAENPANCEGIMGLYTAITTGALPCFPHGPIDAWEIAYQLRLGARTFKEYCPDIRYTTTDPYTLKKCYLYYNAGPRTKMSPNESAYVMNGYDAAHQNMVLTDIHGQQYRLTALGAWPVHLAVQAQLAQQRTPTAPPVVLAPAMLIQEGWDRLRLEYTGVVPQDTHPSDVVLAPEGSLSVMCREPQFSECLVVPHAGDPTLRPHLSPLLVAPVQVGELTCGLLPGIALAPPQSSVVLAPLPGELTRYADVYGHLSVRIENAAWIVWITGLRSYAVAPGAVEAGRPIGAIGGVGSSTPTIQYAVYDKINSGFVDALSFIPATMCPSSG